jgi:hypothetical protein
MLVGVRWLIFSSPHRGSDLDRGAVLPRGLFAPRSGVAANPFRRVPKSKAQRTADVLLSWPRINSKTASPFSSQTTASPSITHDRAGRAATAEATRGKRAVKSLPWRVMSRTPAPSRRARMRMPSCSNSCSHPGPEGGALAGEGRHGSIIPNPGRVRSKTSALRAIGPCDSVERIPIVLTRNRLPHDVATSNSALRALGIWTEPRSLSSTVR